MDDQDAERYSRQVRFRGIGEDGQERLLHARVAIVGCGALGTFQASALLRAGVRKLTLIDRDYVEWSNLQRQWLFTESDAREALPKAAAAREHLLAIDSRAEITARVSDLTPGNIHDLLDGHDLLLDGTDNFETRYLLNDYALDTGVPWIYGAAVGSYGVAMPVIPQVSACLECVFPEAPLGAQDTCETAGVLASITSTVAAWQVALAIQMLCRPLTEVPTKIASFDVWEGVARQIEMPPRDPACAACGMRDFDSLRGERRAPVTLCGRNAVQIHERARPLDLAALEHRLKPLGEVRRNQFALRFFDDPYELTVFPDGRAIIKGTSDTGVARSLYARFIGL